MGGDYIKSRHHPNHLHFHRLFLKLIQLLPTICKPYLSVKNVHNDVDKFPSTGEE